LKIKFLLNLQNADKRSLKEDLTEMSTIIKNNVGLAVAIMLTPPPLPLRSTETNILVQKISFMLTELARESKKYR